LQGRMKAWRKFGSTSVSRAIVRLSMDINSAVKFALPAGLLRAINKRFQHPSDYQINSFSAESARFSACLI
jgi:hypothetical protein